MANTNFVRVSLLEMLFKFFICNFHSFPAFFPTLMLPLVFHFIYILIFSQISSFSMENVLAKTFLQHVFKFHPHNACDQIICCSQPVAVGPSPSPASVPSVAPRLSVAGIFGLTCGMTMPRETNHSHNFKTISNCATSSTSFSCSPSVRIPSIYSSASSPLTFQLFLGFLGFRFSVFLTFACRAPRGKHKCCASVSAILESATGDWRLSSGYCGSTDRDGRNTIW